MNSRILEIRIRRKPIFALTTTLPSRSENVIKYTKRFFHIMSPGTIYYLGDVGGFCFHIYFLYILAAILLAFLRVLCVF